VEGGALRWYTRHLFNGVAVNQVQSEKASLTISSVPLLGKHKGVEIDLQWTEGEETVTLDADPPSLSTERAILCNQERRVGSIEVQCGPNDPLGKCVILKDSMQDSLFLVVVVGGERLELLIQGGKHVIWFMGVLPTFLVFREGKGVIVRSKECHARECVSIVPNGNRNADLWEVSFKKLT
jgi:hypothetical protein